MEDYEEGDEVSLPRPYNPNRCSAEGCDEPLTTAIVMAIGRVQVCGFCARKEVLRVHVKSPRQRPHRRSRRNSSVRLYVYQGGKSLG